VTPILAAAWFSLIWAGKHPYLSHVPIFDTTPSTPVRENNTGALFTIFVIIGIFSVSILPVTLELASEVTRNSDTASAMLWTMGNLMPFIFILGEFFGVFKKSHRTPAPLYLSLPNPFHPFARAPVSKISHDR
jgi:hypothetical protein